MLNSGIIFFYNYMNMLAGLLTLSDEMFGSHSQLSLKFLFLIPFLLDLAPKQPSLNLI